MTRRPWRLHAARAPFPFRHLFALPSLRKSNPYTTKNLAILTRFYPQILPGFLFLLRRFDPYCSLSNEPDRILCYWF